MCKMMPFQFKGGSDKVRPANIAEAALIWYFNIKNLKLITDQLVMTCALSRISPFHLICNYGAIRFFSV